MEPGQGSPMLLYISIKADLLLASWSSSMPTAVCLFHLVLKASL